MFQSFDAILDGVAIHAKQHRLFDVSVIADVLARTETGRWPGTIDVLKVTGKNGQRTLTLGCDPATALLISHEQSGILARINPLLGGLAVDHLDIQHYQQDPSVRSDTKAGCEKHKSEECA